MSEVRLDVRLPELRVLKTDSYYPMFCCSLLLLKSSSRTDFFLRKDLKLYRNLSKVRSKTLISVVLASGCSKLVFPYQCFVVLCSCSDLSSRASFFLGEYRKLCLNFELF